MKLTFVLVAVVCAFALVRVFGQNNANYDEGKVGVFRLPDPLVLESGEKVRNGSDWSGKRRPELLRVFEQQVYGKSPERPQGLRFEVFEEDKKALGGKATRKQVRIYFSEKAEPKMDLLIYLPNDRKGPAPAFLGLNFAGNHTVHSDPGIRLSTSWMRNSREDLVQNNRATEASRGTSARRWPVEKILEAGYALATAYYGDIDPDFHDGFKNGVHPLFYKEGQSAPTPDEWGSIGAWAWGLSRALDYLEKEKEIDAKKVAVMGHSRLGKTSLWAGAQDERFAIVISNNSGCGGAALSRRNYGETVQRINSSFPHWFCGNFKQYDSNDNPPPVDQHQLLALIAPRPVYVASAEEDQWADPRGEFLSAKHASPVYELLGKEGLPAKEMPGVNEPVMGTIGYHIRTGKHDVTDYDWEQYIKFADKHLK